MKLSAIKLDSARAEQGAWIDEIPDMGDLRLRVRGLRNADARRLRQQLMRSMPKDRFHRGILKPKAEDELNAKITSQAVLVDWANLTDEQDQPIPYSREKAFELLSDPDFSMFRDAVSWAASVVSDEAEEQDKADAGN